MSAFEKRQTTQFGQYTSPPVTFSQLSGNTPNKRIRSEHLDRNSRGFSRLEHPSPQANSLQRRVNKLCPAMQPFTLAPPVASPIVIRQDCSPKLDHIKATFRAEPPPGIAPEAGIQWLETAESHEHVPCGDEPATTLGSTPEMPADHLPWCGSACPPKAPRLKSRPPPPTSPESPFELTESEYMRYGYEYFGHTQLPAELNDEWADDLEDEARHDGIVTLPDSSGSFLANSGLAMTLEAEDFVSMTPETQEPRDPWLQSHRPTSGQLCGSMLCSPILQGMTSSHERTPYSWGCAPQANSALRESSNALLDSSDDDIEPVIFNRQEEEDEPDEGFMFDFSPTVPNLGEESLKHMDDIHI